MILLLIKCIVLIAIQFEKLPTLDQTEHSIAQTTPQTKILKMLLSHLSIVDAHQMHMAASTANLPPWPDWSLGSLRSFSPPSRAVKGPLSSKGYLPSMISK